MKRTAALVSALALCFTLLTSCGTGAPPAANNGGTSNGNTNTEASYVFRVAHGDDPTDTCWKHRWCNRWGELMQEYSNGQICYEVYPSGQMGDETEMTSSCSLNSLEGTIVAATNLANYVPAVNYNNLPFMFDNCDEAREVGAKMGDFVMEKSIEEGNVRTTISYTIPRQLSTKKAVTCLADIKGMKVRVPSTDSMIKCYEAWGATPVVISWAETYTALQQGVADAQDNPIQLLRDGKLCEVQNYVTDTDYLIQCNCFVMSSDWYNSLPADCQAAVDRRHRRGDPVHL